MTTTNPEHVKEKAHDVARKIENERPLQRDKSAPEGQVTGGFNQKAGREERTGSEDHREDGE